MSSGRKPAGEPLRDDAQQIVADRVAERVVDALELVEIEIHDRERRAVAPCAVERLGELLVEAGPVRQLGDRVEVREAVNLLDRARSLGRILDRPGHAGHGAGGAEQRLGQHVHVALLAVRTADAHVVSRQNLAAREPHQPALERPAIVGVDQTQDGVGPQPDLRRIDAEDAEHLARADDAVARARPLPVSDAGYALRAGQLLRQAAAGGAFALRRLVGRLEPLLAPGDAPVHVFQAPLQADQLGRLGLRFAGAETPATVRRGWPGSASAPRATPPPIARCADRSRRSPCTTRRAPAARRPRRSTRRP